MKNIVSTDDRRHFLRAGSACIALPTLESFAAEQSRMDPDTEQPHGPRNFVAIGAYLGWHQNAFYPEQTGRDYEVPATLQPIAPYRDDFTVFSGLDHRAGNGHGNWSNFLCGDTAARYSFDQLVADHIGQKSRFASLQLTTGSGEDRTGKGAMNFSRENIYLPMMRRPSVLYRQMFITGEDRIRTEYLLKSGKSSLDHVVDQAKRLTDSLPIGDREKLDEYFHSDRSLEGRMARQLTTLDNPARGSGLQVARNTIQSPPTCRWKRP